VTTTPPLQGLRIIECSALGPAAITTALVDLGADVIKVEPPAGDYIREMTWPIVEGTSLMHLHLNRGKRSLVLDLRTDAGVDIFKELAAVPTSWSRPCVPARWPGAASGSRTCAP
jgi:crotonobetainyl-CoA:carnitine CoA-transferase CaiB-like acyl-CoA transferase